jgi:hypothetical protein
MAFGMIRGRRNYPLSWPDKNGHTKRLLSGPPAVPIGLVNFSRR